LSFNGGDFLQLILETARRQPQKTPNPVMLNECAFVVFGRSALVFS